MKLFPHLPLCRFSCVSKPEVTPSLQSADALSEAVAGLGTVEEVMKYLEPERWQLDMEDLYKPTWHILGKSFLHNKKSRGMADSWGCSDRNYSGRKVCHVEREGKTDAVEQRNVNFFKTVLPFCKWQFNVSLAIDAPSLECSTMCLIILG